MSLIDTSTLSIDLRLPTVREFSRHDRCDRCGFQAYYVAQKPSKAELVFCKHHGEAHVNALETQGWDVYNFTSELAENRTKDVDYDE